MKILTVYPTPSHPVNAGNKKWFLSQVAMLKELGHDVYIVCISAPGIREPLDEIKRGIQETKAYWGDRVFIYHTSFICRVWLTLILHFRKKICAGYFKCDDFYPWGLGKFVEGINEKIKFDVCIVNYYWLSKVLRNITIPIKGINTHDIFSFRDLSTNTPKAWMCSSNNFKSLRERLS